MRRTTVVLIAALLGLAGLVGCGDDRDDVSTGDGGDVPASDPGADSDADSGEEPSADAGDEPTADLAGRTFSTTTPSGLVEGTALRVSFEADTIGIHAGCNQMTGGYALEGDTLVVADLAGTQMACEPELMEQDERIQAFFAVPVRWHLDTGILTLGPEGETFTLRDEAAQGAQQELVGPTWTLDTLTEGDAASSVPAGVTASITFADDGTYQVAAGCNTGSGTYVEAGTGYQQIDPPALTRKLCDDATMDVEGTVLAVLDGEVATSIVGERLTIEATDGTSLGFTAG